MWSKGFYFFNKAISFSSAQQGSKRCLVARHDCAVSSSPFSADKLQGAVAKIFTASWSDVCPWHIMRQTCTRTVSKLKQVFTLRFVKDTSKLMPSLLTKEKIHYKYVEIKCQLDATEVFIADLIAWSTCYGHHYAHHQELKSIIQLQHPANRTHNPQFHTRPATWKPQHEIPQAATTV